MRWLQSRRVRVGAPLVLVTLLTLFGGACGGDDVVPTTSVGDADGGARDSGDADGDVMEAADAAADADADFGFGELDAPEPADAGTDSTVPDPPAEFSCNEERWGDGAHCDCGCLAEDPDCAGREACTEPSCEADGCDVRHDETGAAIMPADYGCDEATFDSLDGCDCGCGAIDPDCIGNGCIDGNCKEEACTRCRDDDGALLSCLFTCDEALLDDGICDCGCGASDPDCSELGCPEPGCVEDACERCYGPEGELLACERGMCPAGFKLDGACDCGCRERDPDCAGVDDWCLTPSCSGGGCARCYDATGEQLLCEDWTCELESPGMPPDGCNCGCGAMDPDCGDGEGCSEPGCIADGCTTCRTEDGAPMSCMP
jgi:hypothetical protein